MSTPGLPLGLLRWERMSTEYHLGSNLIAVFENLSGYDDERQSLRKVFRRNHRASKTAPGVVRLYLQRGTCTYDEGPAGSDPSGEHDSLMSLNASEVGASFTTPTGMGDDKTEGLSTEQRDVRWQVTTRKAKR